MGFGNEDYDYNEHGDLDATIDLLRSAQSRLNEVEAEGALDDVEIERFRDAQQAVDHLVDSTTGRRELYEVDWETLGDEAAEIEKTAAEARRHVKQIDAVVLESYGLDYINNYLDRIIDHACGVQDDAETWARRKQTDR